MRRRLGVVAGVAATVSGLLVTLRPGLVPEFDLATTLVLAVWALALVQFVLVAVRWLGDRRRTRPLPDVDSRPPYPTPGAEVTEALDEVTPGARHDAERTALRERVRTVTVETLSRVERRDETTVRERLDAGSWTDDEDAAALFAADDGDGRSRGGHGEPGFPGRIRAAVAELWRQIEDER